MNPPTAAKVPPQAAQQALQEALTLHRQGKRDLAMQRYVAILQDDPENIDALYYVAVLALQEGQIAEGIRVIERALAVGPPQGRLYNLLGQAHLRLNQDAEALKNFDRAIECEPTFADAYGNRANLLADTGRLDEAVTAFDQALALRPNNAEDLCNRASVLADLGRLEEALAGYERAITLMPELVYAHFNRANALRDLRRLDEALAGYERILAMRPDFVDAHVNCALTLRRLGRGEEALARIDCAHTLRPNDPTILVNRAHILHALGRDELAEAEYQNALRLNSDVSAAHLGLAHICLKRGHFAEARQFAESAARLDPEAPEPTNTLSDVQLILGDWEDGWKNYEARSRTFFPAYYPLPYPRWYGEPLSDERLIVMGEQGLGDVIQFCRLVPLLSAHAPDVVILIDKKMAALISTLAGARVVTTKEEIERDGKPVRWVPMMSLPGILGLRPDTVPAAVPYLSAEPGRIARWATRLCGGGLKIGIAWQPGAARHWYSKRRAIPLTAFAPLAAIAGARLFSLQKGEGVEQIAQVAFRDRIETFGDDFDNGPDAFVDTAAIVMNLDLVVTCDTSIAHLAGALARPVFLALALTPCWRWLLDREDTPWYPTARLFRQTKLDDWTDVFERISAEVRALVRLA
jgi:tetratricopeptide (TPR) repeat protein